VAEAWEVETLAAEEAEEEVVEEGTAAALDRLGEGLLLEGDRESAIVMVEGVVDTERIHLSITQHLTEHFNVQRAEGM